MNNEEDLTKKIANIMWLVFSILGSVSTVIVVGLKFGWENGFLYFAVLNFALGFYVLRKANKLKNKGDL